MADASAIHLEVVTRTGVALRADVEEVQAPSVNGEFGVLPGHLPLLAALKSGILSWKSAGHKGADAKRAVIGPGFAEVGTDKVLVITEHFVPEDEIDPAATRRSLEETREALDKLKADGVESGARYNEFVSRAEWCEAQLALVELWAPGRRGGSKGGETN